MKTIKITTEFIKLDQLLKFANIASTGGHAKFLIKNESIKLNGTVETRRGKKIYPGDQLLIDVSEDYNFDGDEITLTIEKK
jgi:ribosome-associated protein